MRLAKAARTVEAATAATAKAATKAEATLAKAAQTAEKTAAQAEYAAAKAAAQETKVQAAAKPVEPAPKAAEAPTGSKPGATQPHGATAAEDLIADLNKELAPAKPIQPTTAPSVTKVRKTRAKAPRPKPGSPEHKASRWEKYQKRGGKWGYDQWSKAYELNLTRAIEANKAVDAFHKTLGWGKREVTVKVQGSVERRLDIADVATKRGIEYKTGSLGLDPEIVSEMARDARLIQKGWSIEWVIEGKATQGAIDLMKELKIPYSFR